MLEGPAVVPVWPAAERHGFATTLRPNGAFASDGRVKRAQACAKLRPSPTAGANRLIKAVEKQARVLLVTALVAHNAGEIHNQRTMNPVKMGDGQRFFPRLQRFPENELRAICERDFAVIVARRDEAQVCHLGDMGGPCSAEIDRGIECETHGCRRADAGGSAVRTLAPRRGRERDRSLDATACNQAK